MLSCTLVVLDFLSDCGCGSVTPNRHPPHRSLVSSREQMLGLIVWLVEADVVLGQFKVRSVVICDSDNYL